jgi:hypothetical protein
MPSITALCQAGELKTAYEQAQASFATHPHSLLAQNELHQVVCACLEKAGRDAAPAAAVRWLQKLASLQLPAHAFRDDRLCWALRAVLAAFGNNTSVSAAAVGDVLQAMLPLVLSEAPSKARSILLQAGLKHKQAVTVEWLTWWNLASLRPEDWQLEPFNGRKPPMTLAEQALGAAARSLLGSNPPNPTAINQWLPQFDTAIERLPAAQWLPYYKAKLQLRTYAELTAVLPLLLPIVRQKSTEFWAWHLLAETLEATDPAAALACLYRATTCGSEEKFLGKVRLKLAGLLADSHPGEARWHLEKAQASYAAEGWNLKGEGQRLAVRFAAHPAAPAEAARREWLALAEQTTYGDLPWQSVVLQRITEETADRPATALLLPSCTPAQPWRVPLRKYRWLQKLAIGSPLQLRGEEMAGRPRVVQLARRPEGQPWDVLPAEIAVLTSVKPDQSVAFFVVRPGLSAFLRPADFDLTSVAAGEVLQLRLLAREKAGETWQQVLAAERTSASPDTRVCRDFTGALRLHDAGFGFADNVFVPAALLQPHGWPADTPVTGRAVLQFNKKKGRDDWAAVSVRQA